MTPESPSSCAPSSDHTPWTSSWASGMADLKQRLQQPPQLAPDAASRSPTAPARRPGPRLAISPAAQRLGSGGSGDGPQAMAPWVETGAAVSHQYDDVRQAARDLALARNQYFQQVNWSKCLKWKGHRISNHAVPGLRVHAVFGHPKAMRYLGGLSVTAMTAALVRLATEMSKGRLRRGP